MPAATVNLTITTQSRTDFVALSGRIRAEAGALLRGSGVLHAYVPHTTAGICINEGYDPDVVEDVSKVLERIVPWKADTTTRKGTQPPT